MSPETMNPRRRNSANTWSCGQPAHNPGRRTGTGNDGSLAATRAGRPSPAATIAGVNSPMAGKASLPTQSMPHALTWVSITGSSSSTT